METNEKPSLKETNVTVAVLTYKRPDSLLKLLSSLNSLKRDHLSCKLTVLVVDNDPWGSSRAVVEGSRSSYKYQIIYSVEEQQGIPLARNHALSNAPSDTDVFCFLDDDEWVSENWLESMLAARQATGADIIYGRVENVYPDGVSSYLVKSRVLQAPTHRNFSRITYAASNNVLMDYAKISALQLKFQERMRFTGGSDYLFFREAVDKGAVICWSHDAVAYEDFPVARITWRWIIQRQYRLGNTFAVAERLYGTRAGRGRLFVKGLLRIGLGAILTVTFPFSPYWGMRSIAHLIRGAGIVTGLFGHAYEEYAPAKLEPSKSAVVRR